MNIHHIFRMTLLMVVLAFVMAGPALAQFPATPLQIGTINPGDSIVVSFEVTVNTGLGAGVTAVCNQGTISGSNFASVDTDDPDTATPADPTCTEIVQADVGVIAINSPADTCQSAGVEVTVTLKNFTSQSQSNFDVSFEVNGPISTGPVTETFAGPLAGDAMAMYTFTATIDLSTPGSYTIQAWTDLLIDANAANDTATTTISAFPLPIADAGADQTIVEGDAVQIGGSPTASGGTAPYTYAWTPATGLNDATLANPTASPTTTTEYIVVVTDANNCTGSDTVTVEVLDACALSTVIHIAIDEIDEILATQTMPQAARDELEAAQADLTLALSYLDQGDQHNANIALQSGWEHGEAAAEEGADLTNAINAMLGPSRNLAVCTIDIATPLAQGNYWLQLSINYANSQLAKGDADANNGKNFQAIEHYLNAYGAAQYVIDQTTGGNSTNASGNPNAATLAKSGASSSSTLKTGSSEVATQMTELRVLPDGESVRLTWATVLETSNKGFYIYRAERKIEDMKKVKSRNKDGMPEDKEYKRITNKLIPGAGSSDQLLSYSDIDTKVKTGYTYYYKIAQVSEVSKDRGKGTAEQETLHGVISALVTGKAARLALAKGSPSGTAIGEPSLDALPAEFGLQQNYPNPFNPTTTIRYQLPVSSEVSLVIYNLRGQVVRQLAAGQMPAGTHSLQWDGRSDTGAHVVSGVYVYKLTAGTFVQVRRMVLLK